VNYSIPAGIDSSPALGSDGTIYVGANDRQVYALNPNGTKKWSFLTGGALHRASPVIGSDGAVYIGSRDGIFYALNADGTWRWQFSAAAEIDGTAAIDRRARFTLALLTRRSMR